MHRDPFVVIFDIETQDLINNMPGSSRSERICNLQVSCVSCLQISSELVLNQDSQTSHNVASAGKCLTLWRDEDSNNEGPFEPLFRLFDDAEVISAYNGQEFDFKVLLKYCNKKRWEQHVLKCHDSFARLRDATGKWFALSSLLKVNNISAKTADGIEAVAMWRDGRREQLQSYCERDVTAYASLILMPEIVIPSTSTKIPNYIFGIASAIAAARTSSMLTSYNKRKREETLPDSGAG
jgi:hypothetical protein